MPATLQPRDRTKTEHLAVVDQVIWSSEDAQRVIVALTDGHAAIGPGNSEQFASGTKIRFLGRWKDTPTRGPQFHFDTFIADVPPSRKGQIDYLTNYAPNVGKATAEKLCDKYGYEAVRTLRERPELVADDEIMSYLNANEASLALQSIVKLERTKIDLFELFKGRGFAAKAVDSAIEKWGAKAPVVIRRNPFALLTAEMPGAGFKRCDRLWQELGLPLNRLKRQMLCGWAAIRDSADGHTWARGEDFVEAVKSTIAGPTEPVKAIKLGLRAGWLRKRRDEHNHLWLAESDKAIAEERVADRVRVLSAGSVLWPRELPVSQVEGDGLPSRHQVDTAAKALASPLGILAGSPGTGKTHTLAFILRELILTHGEESVAVCAPTGKAAVRATQSLQRLGLPIKATTIHRLLEIGRNGHDGKGWGFQRNRDNPLFQRFVIVDETSMIDTTLLADLLDATTAPVELAEQQELIVEAGEPIPPRCLRCQRLLTDPDSQKIGYGPDCAKQVSPEDYRELIPKIASQRMMFPALPTRSVPGTHVLLIGDPHQLAPVGHGAPLRDLIASGVVAYGELSEIRRNAGLIVEACRDIKAGAPFCSADKVDLDAGRNLMFLETKNEADSLRMLENVLKGLTRFDPVWQTQILVAINKKSQLSRESVNDRVRGWLNPEAGDAPQFAPNDKVICLRNSQAIPHMVDPGRVQFNLPIEGPRHYLVCGDEEFLANGETGRVLCRDHTWAVVRFREDQPGDELITKIWLQKKKGAFDDEGTAENFALAYAISGHKSQGSESPCVIVLADPSASMVASREWWYTTISRASKLCIVIGQRGLVQKQCGKVSLVKRKTFLQQLLLEGLI